MSDALSSSIQNDFASTFAAAVDAQVSELPSVDSNLVQKAALGGLMQSILDVFKQLGASALGHLPEIKAAALNIYDTKVAPIQILPAQYAAFEAIIDAGGRALVEKAIDAIAAALATPTTT